ncbi:MAG: hypothetical protein ACLQDY_26080 [Streptosporangiaceae bacterium]
MIRNVRHGQTVLIPRGKAYGVTEIHATVAQLREALTAIKSLSSTSPVNFPIRGFGCHQAGEYYTAWCAKFEIDGDYCDPNGCQLEDRETVNVTDNPGPKKSKVSYKAVYFPDHGDFRDIRFRWWSFCYRSKRECGTEKVKGFKSSGSGIFYPTSNVNLSGGHDLIHSSQLSLTFVPNGQNYTDQGRTGTAVCNPTPPVTGCVYAGA